MATRARRARGRSRQGRSRATATKRSTKARRAKTRRAAPKRAKVGRPKLRSTKKKPAKRTGKGTPAKKKVARKAADGLVKRRDLVGFLREQADRIAAPDVTALVAQAPAIRAKAGTLDEEGFRVTRRQISDALACLEDYAAGRCPQIPYSTVAILTAALFYFQSQIDILPDFLPHIGVVDDAVVMGLATQMAGEGIERYLTWREATGA